MLWRFVMHFIQKNCTRYQYRVPDTVLVTYRTFTISHIYCSFIKKKIFFLQCAISTNIIRMCHQFRTIVVVLWYNFMLYFNRTIRYYCKLYGIRIFFVKKKKKCNLFFMGVCAYCNEEVTSIICLSQIWHCFVFWVF